MAQTNEQIISKVKGMSALEIITMLMDNPDYFIDADRGEVLDAIIDRSDEIRAGQPQ